MARPKKHAAPALPKSPLLADMARFARERTPAGADHARNRAELTLNAKLRMAGRAKPWYIDQSGANLAVEMKAAPLPSLDQPELFPFI